MTPLAWPPKPPGQAVEYPRRWSRPDSGRAFAAGRRRLAHRHALVAVAVVVRPSAVLSAPLAFVDAPIARLAAPLAVVPEPNAVLVSPLASVLRPERAAVEAAGRGRRAGREAVRAGGGGAATERGAVQPTCQRVDAEGGAVVPDVGVVPSVAVDASGPERRFAGYHSIRKPAPDAGSARGTEVSPSATMPPSLSSRMAAGTRRRQRAAALPPVPAPGVSTNEPLWPALSRPRSADGRQADARVDVRRRTARRRDDRQAHTDGAVGVREGQCRTDAGAPRRPALVVGAIDVVLTAVLHHRDRDHVAVRLQLPAERAEGLCRRGRKSRGDDHEHRQNDETEYPFA